MRLLVLFSWYLKVSRIQSTTSVLCVSLLCAFLDLELGGRRAATGVVCFWKYGFLALEGAVLTDRWSFSLWGEILTFARPGHSLVQKVLFCCRLESLTPRVFLFHEAKVSPQLCPPTDSASSGKVGSKTLLLTLNQDQEMEVTKKISVENHYVLYIGHVYSAGQNYS